ncbi:RES family NAD+ phosphorylase [Pseudomonas aeruginosa]
MICIDCVSPAPLKKLFEAHGNAGVCKYCQSHGDTLEPKLLFKYIYERVEENVARKDDLSHYELGLLYHCGSDFIAVSDIGIVLSEWFDLGEEPYFEELCAGLPKEFLVDDHGDETHFYGDDGTLEQNIYEACWDKFVDDVRYTHRFFNTGANRFLDSVFSMLVSDDNGPKPEVIRNIAPGELLYRARYAKDVKQAEEIIRDPSGQFGRTPRYLASSQRMTPHGISALYCAMERKTCLSEIRSITGDHVVSVALTPITGLRLLDLTALDRLKPPALTLLDEGFRETLHRVAFLGSLVQKMSRPKARNDELSYLATQVVFEYLRLRFGEQVDGLVFPSVQTGEAGTNVVLFPEASRLAHMPPMDPEADVDPGEPAPVAPPIEDDNPFEAPAKLSIVVGSLRFHKVKAIETKASEHRYLSDLFMNDLVRKRLGLPE